MILLFFLGIGERGVAEEGCISYKNKAEECKLQCDNQSAFKIHGFNFFLSFFLFKIKIHKIHNFSYFFRELCYSAFYKPSVTKMQKAIMKYGSLFCLLYIYIILFMYLYIYV